MNTLSQTEYSNVSRITIGCGGEISVSHMVLRLKNDIALMSRLLYSLMNKNSSYSIKEYSEEPDPTDNNYIIISFTAYERGPYSPIRRILKEFIKNNEVEYLNESSIDRFA